MSRSNEPVKYSEAARGYAEAGNPSLWRGIQFDWVPLLPSINPFFDMGSGKRHMVLSGTGITYKISSVHRGLPVARHTGSSGHLERARIPGFDLNHTDVWTIAARFSVTDIDADDRTIFSKRVPSGVNQFALRVDRGSAPQEIEVRFGATLEGGSATVININIPYIVFLTNDGSGATGGWNLYIHDAEGSLLTSLSAPDAYTNANPEAPFWLCASFSDTNDPLVGDHAGARGWSRLLNAEERQILALDWHAPYRLRRRIIGRAPAAVLTDPALLHYNNVPNQLTPFRQTVVAV